MIPYGRLIFKSPGGNGRYIRTIRRGTWKFDVSLKAVDDDTRELFLNSS